VAVIITEINTAIQFLIYFILLVKYLSSLSRKY